jgi:two-component system, NtrC family, response regulator GlrR
MGRAWGVLRRPVMSMGDRTMGRDESPGPAVSMLRAESGASSTRSADLPEPDFVRQNLIGVSESFTRVLRKIPRLASSDATVLITGETGTGKEVVAKAIHLNSNRQERPFIPVNCGALPEDLVENELFGHARGAYTGASNSGKGLLAEAEGGTLFLDELNSLSLSAQAKLLRFLQNREYRVLGSTRLLHADVRIVAATNVDLGKEIAAGNFRADLYHRLHVLSVEMPPLRLRREDVPLLAEHFAHVFGRLYGREEVQFHQTALAALQAHEWPGNVRELQSVVERAVLLAPDRELREEDIGLPPPNPDASAFENEESTVPLPTGHEIFRDAKERMVRQFERSYLVQVMAAVDGNVSRAARLAGMQRRDFQRLLRKHDVRRAQPRAWLAG